MTNFIVGEGEVGRRADIVTAEIVGQSRAWAQKMIKNQALKINGLPVKANYLLKAEDRVTLDIPKKVAAANKKIIWPTIAVVAETDDYVVVDKPAGLLTHEASANSGEVTLVDWLLKHYSSIKRVGDNPKRPGIVHRLDREVSGLLVAAKNQPSFNHLKEQFKRRIVFKEYQALVFGALTIDEGEINFPLSRSKNSGKMAARPVNQPGREALTVFRLIKRFINYSYLRVSIKTGRTHQIRAHLAAIGHPLVGDCLYGSKSTKLKNQKINLGRVWLVATKLEFFDLAGEKQSFTIKPPRELKNFLQQIK